MPTQPTAHCRKYRWAVGDCGMLHCSRCGDAAYRRIADRIIRAAMKQTELLFVTVYWSSKRLSLSELPLFELSIRDEKRFRSLLTKILKSLREKAARMGEQFEYIAVLAFGRANHRIHKKVHAHLLVTWLPHLTSKPTKAHPHRLDCSFLSDKLSGLELSVWIERPVHKQAVARYTATNLKTVVGKPEMKSIRAFRFSQGFEL
jgi:hypothetical protein